MCKDLEARPTTHAPAGTGAVPDGEPHAVRLQVDGDGRYDVTRRDSELGRVWAAAAAAKPRQQQIADNAVRCKHRMAGCVRGLCRRVDGSGMRVEVTATQNSLGLDPWK